MSDCTKLTFVGNVKEALGYDGATALMFMAARVNQDRQTFEIVVNQEFLDSLNMEGKAAVLEVLQKAAEYIAASIGSGNSGFRGFISKTNV